MANIIKDVLKDKTLSDLVVPPTPPVFTEPDLTEPKVEAAILLLREVEKNGGLHAIARQVDLSNKQVKKIHKEMLKKITELRREAEENA